MGSACTPWVRPMAMASLNSKARFFSTSCNVARPCRTSAADCFSSRACAVSTTSFEVSPKCSQRDASPQPAVTLQQRKRSIAAQLGIAPETFSRVLRQLRERGLIAGRGRQLRLLNVNGLRSLAGA